MILNDTETLDSSFMLRNTSSGITVRDTAELSPDVDDEDENDWNASMIGL